MAKQFLDYAGLQAFWEKVKAAIAANKVTVDSTLSDTSENPVQNKVINAAIVTLAQAIEDNEVTVSSTLTSGTKIATITVGKTNNDIYSPASPGATSGIVLDADANQYKHTNSVTAKTEYVSGTTASTDGGKIIVRDVKYDAQGHITASQDREITLSQDHTKTSITAGTAGTSSATSGTNTLDIPYVSVNANGHVTGYGTHKHTISGFATTGQFNTLSDQVGTNTTNISSLQSAIAGLSSATHFIGVKEELPANANNGDICIIGNKEYIYSKPKESEAGSWKELGDVTEVSSRITEIENSYISSFGGVSGKQKAILLDTDATGVGNVKFAMSGESGNELQATVDVGVTTVKVATATPVENETAETVAVAVEKPFAMITSVSQTNGTVNVGTTELGPIPISAITALS